ncbi:glutathione S-transferase [Hyphomonas neptunium ATCC 15444]|uniref:Glutathione S-transferase n=2 Tax=Hyphomonas TaxID=85 RepID=Q0C3F6_HYPNA|nr:MULTISPECIES: glutathione S-transferase family protein [Hyphomonas]ABI75767.1 glutathione S-transferase [Hyphomonas neptunium ATCC 15444]KCZ96054.1 glutathione S-transferase [Hyphomonas hirschiana VP5]
MREVTAYNWVPDFAQGFVKDLRVRWALEEAGLTYTERLIDHEQKLQPEHMARQPFAQVPVYKDDGVEMFESAAIVLHIAQGSDALMPKDAAARARVTSWCFAALNSIEPYVMNVTGTQLFHADAPWAEGYLASARGMLDMRLNQLSGWLKGQDYLEAGRFTAADLLMASVLRELERDGTLGHFPELEAYCQQCLSRPAFRRALEAQLAVFAKAEVPAGV